MKKIGLIIKEKQFPQRPKNLSTEFQVYGVYLAETLADTKHYSLYIKLAKQYERSLLEEVLNYVKDAVNVESRGKLFMWRLKKLRMEKAEANDHKAKK